MTGLLEEIQENTRKANDPFNKAVLKVETASKSGKSKVFYDLKDEHLAKSVHHFFIREGFRVSEMTNEENILSFPTYQFLVSW